ncbi:stalk domain-containing protein [Filifactor alocis]|uniref:stalk domain-containing protein n=1 Tax=Filifactor alocis TaxID=143361 RepID=UPI003FA047D7
MKFYKKALVSGLIVATVTGNAIPISVYATPFDYPFNNVFNYGLPVTDLSNPVLSENIVQKPNSNGNPVIEVTAPKNVTITVYNSQNEEVGKSTVGDFGKVDVILNKMKVGDGKIVIVATEVGKNPSVPTPFQLDVTAPAKVIVDVPTEGDVAVKVKNSTDTKFGDKIILTIGTNKVEIVKDNDGWKLNGQVVAINENKLQIPVNPLVQGTNIEVVISDEFGNTSEPTTVTVAKKIVIPNGESNPVSFSNIHQKKHKGNGNPVLEVKAPIKATIIVKNSTEEELGRGIVDDSGKISIELNRSKMSNGNVKIIAIEEGKDQSKPTQFVVDITAPHRPYVDYLEEGDRVVEVKPYDKLEEGESILVKITPHTEYVKVTRYGDTYQLDNGRELRVRNGYIEIPTRRLEYRDKVEVTVSDYYGNISDETVVRVDDDWNYHRYNKYDRYNRDRRYDYNRQYRNDRRNEESRKVSEKTVYVFTHNSSVIEITKGIQSDYRTIDTKPFISEGRIMLPLRYVAEVVDAEVYWTETTNTATFVKGSKRVDITLGTNIIRHSDGTVTKMDTKAVARDGRMFVPLKYVQEIFSGSIITWDNVLKAVTIEK